MTPRFHALTIDNIRKETEDTISIAFEIPSELEKDFSYLQHKTYEVVNCRIQERFLMTDSLSEKLFGQNCVATDGGCSVDSNYIIWDKEAANSCHLNLITQTNITRNGNSRNCFLLLIRRYKKG